MDEKDVLRLETARNIWLATVRANGAPHLVPIWFVWLNDKAYLCASKKSVKARNILRNPRVVFALEDGDEPVVIEGDARILNDIPSKVQKKFDWNIRGDGTYNLVIEITPTRVVL